MRLIIDIVLLVIVALCTWSGYKKGLIGGIAGILAVIIALFGGSLLSPDDYKCAFFEGGWYDRYCETLAGWRNLNPM